MTLFSSLPRFIVTDYIDGSHHCSDQHKYVRQLVNATPLRGTFEHTAVSECITVYGAWYWALIRLFLVCHFQLSAKLACTNPAHVVRSLSAYFLWLYYKAMIVFEAFVVFNMLLTRKWRALNHSWADEVTGAPLPKAADWASDSGDSV